jgi:hypothetical protein
VIGLDGGNALQVLAQGADGTLLASFENGPGATDFSAFAPIGVAGPPASPPLASGPAPASTPAPAAKPILVTLDFTYTAARRSTRLRTLVVKGVPRGATVTVSCPNGCSRRSLVKRNVRSSSVSLAAMVRRALKVGTTITVTVSAPNAISAVKTLKVRSRRAPSLTTRCLPPGASKPAHC